MSVYMFNQSIGSTMSKADSTKRFLEKALEENDVPIKCVFMEMSSAETILPWEKAGIGQLIGMYQHFTDNKTLKPLVKVEEKLEELKEVLRCTGVERHGSEIWLVKDGYVIASIFLNEKDRDYVRSVSYFSFTKLVRSETYFGDITYVEHFKTARSENGGLYAKLTRRTFLNRDNSVAFDQIFGEGKEWYLFPDGRRYTKLQLMVEFVRGLKLSKEDIVLLDDSMSDELVQAVFTFGRVARIVVVAHAGRHFEIEKAKNKEDGISEGSILKEYPYKWFRYAEVLDTIIVSTNSQKELLQTELEAYHCRIPNIEVASIEGEFTYTILHESYGGNMALSWTFQGKPDGFLIYDELENQLYETRNEHQHYQLIKGCEKGYGFVVKAFVDTACGRTVIAESELVYLSMRPYEKPLVSLIIPVYNAEKYIARTLDNALAQSLTDLEIIAVDDGCVDSSPEILEWYAKKYPNVVVIHKENGGVAEARNTGIETAWGEYIGFMDNDDMIRPEMMRKLYDAAKRSDSDIAITSYYEIRGDGYLGMMEYPMEEGEVVSAEKFLQEFYMTGNEGGCVVWNKLHRSSLVKMHKIPNMPFDDLAWTTCMLLYAKKVCYLNGHFYEWDRMVRGSTLLGEWYCFNREDVVERRKNVILFYLENGNPEKRELLKEVIKIYLLRWKRDSGYEEYEELWRKIEASY